MSITFEFSKQEGLLKQYYKLREECFRNELGLEAFDGTEDLFDQTGHILIFRDGDICIGGVRITGCSLFGRSLVPLEQKGLDISQMLPQLSLTLAPYCQWERLVLRPEYRGIDMLKGICKALIRGCASLGYHYAFNVTGIKRARLYKRVHSNLGFDYEIYNQLEMPVENDFSHLEHLLSIAHIPKAERDELVGADDEQVFAGLWQPSDVYCAA
ncbi:MAG: hypothetical protein V7745_00755 [Pseudomonadales bacterium]